MHCTVQRARTALHYTVHSTRAALYTYRRIVRIVHIPYTVRTVQPRDYRPRGTIREGALLFSAREWLDFYSGGASIRGGLLFARIRYIRTFYLYILLLSVRVRCFNSSLIPIYGWPTDRITRRDTYTHAMAVEQGLNLPLGLAGQYFPDWTGCIKEFGRRTLQLTGLTYLFTCLNACQDGQCYYMESTSSQGYFHLSTNIDHVSFSIWLFAENLRFIVPLSG